MPSYFKKIEDGDVEILPFNRFHLSEATGERVKTIHELPGDVIELTHDQARDLITKWNSDFPYSSGNIVYSL